MTSSEVASGSLGAVVAALVDAVRRGDRVRERTLEFFGAARRDVIAAGCIGDGAQACRVFVGGVAESEPDQVDDDPLLAQVACRLHGIPAATLDAVGDENERPVAGTLVEIAKEDQTTMAAAYMDAMHEMCVSCHEERKEKLEEPNEDFDRCTTCHRDLPRLEDDAWKSRL